MRRIRRKNEREREKCSRSKKCHFLFLPLPPCWLSLPTTDTKRGKKDWRRRRIVLIRFFSFFLLCLPHLMSSEEEERGEKNSLLLLLEGEATSSSSGWLQTSPRKLKSWSLQFFPVGGHSNSPEKRRRERERGRETRGNCDKTSAHTKLLTSQIPGSCWVYWNSHIEIVREGQGKPNVRVQRMFNWTAAYWTHV